jgi:hypothetical protein
LFQQDFKPDLPWSVDHKVWADTAYLGMRSLFEAIQLNIPYRKPRKSKNNPDPKFTQTQLDHNHWVGKHRVVAENAICGSNRYNVLVYRFRNKTIEFADDMMELAYGLWNLKVSQRIQS